MQRSSTSRAEPGAPSPEQAQPVEEYILVRRDLNSAAAPPPKAAPALEIVGSCAASSSSPQASREAPRDLVALKRGLTAVPSSGGRSGRRKRGKVYRGLCFDIVAGRPRASLMSPDSQIMRVTARYDVSTWFASSTTVPTFVAQNFTLTMFDAAALYVTVFDQYKIDCIEVWIELTGPTVNNYVPMLTTAVDLDDSTTPTTYATVADRQGSTDGLGACGRYHKWEPHVAVAVYSGAFTSFGSEPGMWLDVASPAVQHYGIKAASLPSVPSGVVATYNLSARAVISFKGPKIA